MPLCTVTDTCCSGQPLVTLTSNTGAVAATPAPPRGGACVWLRPGAHELRAGECVFSEGPTRGRSPAPSLRKPLWRAPYSACSFPMVVRLTPAAREKAASAATASAAMSARERLNARRTPQTATGSSSAS